MILDIIFIILVGILAVHRITHKREYEGRLSIAFLIPLGIAAASAVYQGIKGAKQKREAQRVQDEADRQERANLSEAQRMALSGMPRDEYMKQLQSIYRNQASALGYLRDRKSALAAVGNIQQSSNDATLSLNAQNAQMKREAERTALGQANRIASLKGQEAAYKRESGQAMTGAAFQNIFNAAGYGAMALAGNGEGGDGTGSTTANRASDAMRPLDGTLYGKGGYKGGLGLNYSKPY